MIDRTYDLNRLPKGESIEGDIWLLELSYEQIADDHARIVFTPQQRVAFAAEIFDADQEPVSPQPTIQSLPSSITMVRLSIPPQSVKAAVVLKPIG